jgi:hypothetical protein
MTPSTGPGNRHAPAFGERIMLRQYIHWHRLIGMTVQIRQHGQIIRTGTVDDAMADSTALWIAGDAAQPCGEVREEVARDPGAHEGNGKIVEVADPLNFPGVGGVECLDACLGRFGWFHGEDMGAQALAVRGRLFIQAAGALNVTSKDRCCGHHAAAAALASDQAEVGKA